MARNSLRLETNLRRPVFCPETGQMKMAMRTRTSSELYDYWNSMRGGETAPLRADINPADIRFILPDIFMLEADEGNDPLFRLAGTGICLLFGKELRGLGFSSLWSAQSRAAAVRAATTVMNRRRPLLLSVEGLLQSDMVTDMEILLLPVRSQANRHDRIIGCLATASPVPASAEPAMLCLEMRQSRSPSSGKARENVLSAFEEEPAALEANSLEAQIIQLFERIKRIGKGERLHMP